MRQVMADVRQMYNRQANYPLSVSLFYYLTDAQVADYQARTAQTSFATAIDLTAAIQSAMDQTYAAGVNLFLPAGAAKLTGTLESPTNSALYEDRGDVWTMCGQGAAQTFVRLGYKGTALVSMTDAPLYRYHQRRAMPTAGGNIEVTGIRFEQQNAAAVSPVVLFDTLCEYASFHHNQIYQGGLGDGLKCLVQIKGEVHHNFAMNANWLAGPAVACVFTGSITGTTLTVSAVTSGALAVGMMIGSNEIATGTTITVGSGGVGTYTISQAQAVASMPMQASAATGVGFNFPVQQNSGLLTLRKNSARGFLWGYVIGDGTNNPSATLLEQNEASSCVNGVWIRAGVTACTIGSAYFEGIQFTCVLDEGTLTTVHGGKFYVGFQQGIDGRGIAVNNYGSSYRNNYIETAGPNTSLIVVQSYGTGGGGASKYVGENEMLYSGSSGVNVKGIVILGYCPRINGLATNAFSPRGNWIGDAKTLKIDNRSLSDDGTPGNGIYGAIVGQSLDKTTEVPMLGRGAHNLAVDGTALVASGVVALGELSVFTLTLATAANVTGFTAPNLPDKTFELHVTNANATFVNGALLKMAGSANFTPGANGAWLKFQIKPGGVAYETGRVAY